MNAADLVARIAAMPPELRLVAACCAPQARTDGAIVTAAAAGPIDGAILVDHARAHRVEGFVEDGLRRAGIVIEGAAADRLARRAAHARLAMLRNAAEEVRLSRAMSAAGIDAVFVKGASLAMLAHGSLALKTAWDIDLLVPLGQAGAAHDRLASEGYRLELPPSSRHVPFERYVAHNKDTKWVSDARGTTVELHTALVDFAPLLPRHGGLRTQKVELARDAAVATLAQDDLLTYLCVHGTSHRWERLKWLADFAALAVRTQGLDAVVEQSRSPSAETAVWLAAHLFAMPLVDRTRGDAATQRLIAMSLDATSCPDSGDTTSAQHVLTALKVQRLQIRGLGSRTVLLWQQLGWAYTPSRAALPRWLLPWHALLWVPWRLATRRLGQARGKVPTTP